MGPGGSGGAKERIQKRYGPAINKHRFQGCSAGYSRYYSPLAIGLGGSRVLRRLVGNLLLLGELRRHPICMRSDTYLIFHKDHPLHLHGVNAGAEMATLYLATFLARAGKRVVLCAQVVEGEQTHEGVECWDLGPDYNVGKALERASSLGPYHLISCGRAQSILESRKENNCVTRSIMSQDRQSCDTGISARVLSLNVDNIICASNAQREFFISDGADPALVHVVHNGADQEIFRPGYPQDRDFRRIVFAGALVVDKGVHLLLQSFADLKQKHPDIRLDVYGSAEMWGRDKVFDERELEAKLPGLTFHGAVDRTVVAEAYRTAGIAAVPSIWFDPFPLTAVEAQVCGCPVVTFNVGGLGESILHGRTGLVLDDVSQEALTQALDVLLSSPDQLRSMCETAISWAREEYSWEKVAQSVVNLCSNSEKQVSGVNGAADPGSSLSDKKQAGARITVGIVTHNRVRYLKEAVESVLSQQSYVEEIIVVDDASADGTREYLSRLNEPKLHVIYREKNGGRSASRNEVVKAMKGDWLLWLDDDDTLTPDAIETQLECLKNHPEAEIIGGNYTECDEMLRPIKPRDHRIVPREQLLMHLVFENILPNGGVMLRREVFDKVGLYNTEFPRSQDYEFWVRAALADCRFIQHEKRIYNVRMHRGNLANPANIRRQSELQCRILRYMLENATLERIFPTLDWRANAGPSAAEALGIVAKVFFDHGDDEAALDCIKQAEQFHPSEGALLIKAFILRALNRTDEATEAFANAVVGLNPSLKSFLVELGAPRGSAAVAERAKDAAKLAACR